VSEISLSLVSFNTKCIVLGRVEISKGKVLRKSELLGG
jgi:hypothetical protein